MSPPALSAFAWMASRSASLTRRMMKSVAGTRPFLLGIRRSLTAGSLARKSALVVRKRYTNSIDAAEKRYTITHMQTAQQTYTAHVTGSAECWRGVVRRDGETVWTSAETFRNRDCTTIYSRSARDAARLVCDALNRPEEFEKAAVWMRRNARRPDESAFFDWARERAGAIRPQVLCPPVGRNGSASF